MSAAQFEFTCRVCGERHVGLPAFHFDGPAQLSVIPPEEFDARVELGDDACVIELDGIHRFVRGQLELPIRGMNEPFTWSVWVSLSEHSYARYAELFGDEQRAGGESFFGWLSSALPEYPDTMYLKSRLHVRPYPWRPLIELEPTTHPLSIDQREGLAPKRAAELAERLLHMGDGGAPGAIESPAA